MIPVTCWNDWEFSHPWGSVIREKCCYCGLEKDTMAMFFRDKNNEMLFVFPKSVCESCANYISRQVHLNFMMFCRGEIK
jgi:hypothetical protein